MTGNAVNGIGRSFRVSEDAAVKRPRGRPRRKPEPVYVSYTNVVPFTDVCDLTRAWALRVSGGDRSRIRSLSHTTVVVVNNANC